MNNRRDHILALKAAAASDQARLASALGLQGRGRRYFCPTCQPQGGRTPDLSVTSKGSWRCFKCGKSGDPIDLVEMVLAMDFVGAVRWLEELTGIRRTEPQKRPCNRPARPEKPRPGASCEADSRVERAGTAESGGPAVFEAFLAACRPVEGPALAWLQDKGVAVEVVEACGLRFCGREYQTLMKALKTTFGDDVLLNAGLLKLSQKKGHLVPAFWHYYAKKAGFLVIPYLSNGRPVYLKVRPPLSKDKVEGRGLTRFLNTAGKVPCLYNVDALAGRPDRVLVCEGESDTWAALSAGFLAVGVPGARLFKPEWVGLFAPFQANGRSRVYLALDADAAGAAGSRIIADLFLKAGLPVPLKLAVPAGMDLAEYLKDGKKDEVRL